MKTLILCGLCGGKAEKACEENERLQHAIYYVRCQRCLVRTNGAFVREESFEQWNQVMGLSSERVAAIRIALARL